MKFTKMHGIGNDYVYVNGFQERLYHPQETARLVSDRHFGIGADGLILINPSKTADFEMVMYNADGSRGEMCGNGIRCVAKYVYDEGLTSNTKLKIETLAGIREVEIELRNGKAWKMKVNMGNPVLWAAEIPVVVNEPTVIDSPIAVANKTYKMTCLSMGNPHCVIFPLEDVKNLELDEIGPGFEQHERFPKRVNTEFVNIINEHRLRMRVWERGTGETLACGTGACAAAVAAALNGYTKDEVTVELPGGELTIDWDRVKNQVFMTGTAAVVFEGEIILPTGYE